MPVPYLELHKETKDIKVQVPHGLRHCRINDGEKMGKDQQTKQGWGSPPKVRAAQEA